LQQFIEILNYGGVNFKINSYIYFLYIDYYNNFNDKKKLIDKVSSYPELNLKIYKEIKELFSY
jgi:large-conductance mechanosensitive channel